MRVMWWVEAEDAPAAAAVGPRGRLLDHLAEFANVDEGFRCVDLDDPNRSLVVAFGDDAAGNGAFGVPDSSAFTFTAPELSDSGEADEEPGVLFAIGFDVPSAGLPDFDAWYAEEHAALLLKADGWLRIRRFDTSAVAGAPWTRLAVHYWRSTAVWDAPERAAARTPWRDRLAAMPWFSSKQSRTYAVDRVWHQASRGRAPIA